MFAYHLGKKNEIYNQFHQSTTESTKNKIISQLTNPKSNIRFVFATVSLGMGFDAQHVRKIIHFKAPTTLENYIQETGRAGRDGERAEAVLYYNNNDLRKNRPGLQSAMADYCRSSGKCLRELLLDYLGYPVPEEQDRNNCCQVCSSNNNDTVLSGGIWGDDTL